tara:strand:- start:12052 stop:12738 length:687 start_codon:yes stop_codon:yes gene_type:complete
MFLFSCKYVPNSPVRETVDAIIKHHPNEKIVIVDSDSDDKSYYDFFSSYDNVEILDDCNKDRVPGAFYQVYKKYPDEPYYINIQDCVIMKESIQSWIDSDAEFVSFMYFIEPFDDWNNKCLGNEFREFFPQVDYEIPQRGEDYEGCYGPLFIIKNSLVKKFEQKGFIKSLKSRSKTMDQVFERLWGIVAAQEGWSPSEFNIEGNFSEKHVSVRNGSNKFFEKRYLGRN